MKTPIPRKIFFWTLFVSYFITTSIVLFFVFGYRHDFKAKIFVHTGSLTLKTNPKNISIKLNDKEPKSRLVNVINDSYVLTGLRPGQYKIDLITDGFKQWTKEVGIHSGIATELWNILLIRENYEITKFDIDKVDKFFPAPEENIFATTSQLGKTLAVNVFNTEQNTSINSFIFPQTSFTENKHENIEWSPDTKNLIIPAMISSESEDAITSDDTTSSDDTATTDASIDASTKDYILAFTKNNEHVLLSSFILQTDNVRSVRWDPEEKNTIYFMTEKSLYRMKLDLVNYEESQKEMISQDVLAYDFADDGLYLLNTQGEIVYSGDKKDISDAKILTQFDINTSSTDHRLISYDNQRVMLLDDSYNKLYLYNKGENDIYTKELGTSITGAHFSDDGKKLLFYSPFEIFVYFTRALESQPVRYEDQTQSIIRFSQPIENIHFAKNYEHIIYTVGNEIKITELDYRGDRITETIMSLNNSDTTLINKHKMNKLFMLDTTKHNEDQLQSINFPEKETLF